MSLGQNEDAVLITEGLKCYLFRQGPKLHFKATTTESESSVAYGDINVQS